MRNNLTKLSVETGGRTVSQGYNYKAISGITDTSDYAKENLPTRYSMSSNRYIDYSYDTINRLNLKALNLNGAKLYTNYLYNRSDTRTDENGEKLRTTQLGLEIVGNIAYNYEYDRVGNITEIHKGVRDGTGSTAAATGFEAYRSYEYDGLNQLTRENNASQNKTFTYEYDVLGNILSKKEYAYTTEALGDVVNESAYTYTSDGKQGWNNLLTAVELDGNGTIAETESISYDAIGNPTTYLGAELSWFGRQMQSYTKGDTSVSYTYDAGGLRGSKTVNGVKSEYMYLNGQLVYEKRGDTDIYYNFDSYGNYAGLKWYDADGNAKALYALTNAQGDVLGLYNGNGELKVAYEYDTWGNTISIKGADGNELVPTDTAYTYAFLNPFRYRGYYFDDETGLYYLQSRYYNPQVGRFLNSDNITDSGAGVLGFNTFIYCANNPVNYADPTGHSISGVLAGLGVIAKVVSAIAAILKSALIKAACVGIGVAAGYGISKGIEYSRSKSNKGSKAAVKADEKIKDTVAPDSKERYWKAYRTNNVVTIGEAIDYDEAIFEVASGRNVFTVTRAEAYSVAMVAGGNVEPMWHGKHTKFDKPNYYDHYHIDGHNNDSHVWYLF